MLLKIITTIFDETYYPSTVYAWNTGQSTKSFSIKPKQSTVFKLTATSNGCSSNTDSVSVFVDQYVPKTDAGENSTICRGDSIELNAKGGKKYLWTFDKSLSGTSIANPKAAPYVTTTYSVVATNDFCSSEDKITITVDKCLTSIKTDQISNMSIYPNPTSEIIYIENLDANAMNGYRYRILNALGKEIYNELVKNNLTEIQLKTLGAAGFYLFEVIDQKHQIIQSHKIVLQ